MFPVRIWNKNSITTMIKDPIKYEFKKSWKIGKFREEKWISNNVLKLNLKKSNKKFC